MSTSQARTLELPPNCVTCQYCQNCDPNPDQPKQRLRFCEHGLGRTFVETSGGAASHNDCPATAPLRRSTNSVPQSTIPQASNAPIPEEQSDKQRQDKIARQGSTWIDARASDYAKAQWGHKYDGLPDVESPMVWRGVEANGFSDVHAGNVYTNVNARVLNSPPNNPSGMNWPEDKYPRRGL